jgi:hypothetical protein
MLSPGDDTSVAKSFSQRQRHQDGFRTPVTSVGTDSNLDQKYPSSTSIRSPPTTALPLDMVVADHNRDA